jgi:hypothetical protein
VDNHAGAPTTTIRVNGPGKPAARYLTIRVQIVPSRELIIFTQKLHLVALLNTIYFEFLVIMMKEMELTEIELIG